MTSDNVAPGRRPYTFDRVVRLVISLVALAGVIWLVNLLRDVLLPFLVAWLIAYILEPFVQYNRRLMGLKGRFVAVFLTLFECMLLVFVLCMFLLPSISAEMRQVGELVNRYATGTAGPIPFIPASVHDYLRDVIDFRTISQEMTSQDFRSILNAVGGMLSSGIEMVMWLVSWFLVLLYVVFIMLDYDKLLHGMKRLVPPKFRDTTFSVLDDVKRSMNHYFRGQALVALCVGIMFSIGFSLIGLPLAVVMGIFIGVLNMVPYLQFISIIPITLLCMICSVENTESFWPMWWSCIAIYAIVQCIQDLILTPKIMGKMMGLNPAIILLSLSLWGTLLGFIGLIIALPLTTLLLSYYNQYISNREDGETPASRAADAEALSDMSTYPDD